MLSYHNDHGNFLKNWTRHIRERITLRLKEVLTKTSIPSDTKFIGRDNLGEKVFRLRIGDYRALYKIKGKSSSLQKLTNARVFILETDLLRQKLMLSYYDNSSS